MGFYSPFSVILAFLFQRAHLRLHPNVMEILQTAPFRFCPEWVFIRSRLGESPRSFIFSISSNSQLRGAGTRRRLCGFPTHQRQEPGLLGNRTGHGCWSFPSALPQEPSQPAAAGNLHTPCFGGRERHTRARARRHCPPQSAGLKPASVGRNPGGQERNNSLAALQSGPDASRPGRGARWAGPARG